MKRLSIDALLDFLWPHVDRLTPSERDEQKHKETRRASEYKARIGALAGRDATEVQGHAAHLVRLIEDEDRRRATVDSRLLGVIGLSSVAGTLVLAIAGSRANSDVIPLPLQVTSTALLIYMIVQLLSALLAAVKGLDRRGYLASKPETDLPAQGESSSAFTIRQMQFNAERLADHAEQNNMKVTQLAVAYRGLKQFLLATLLFSLLLAAGSYWKRPSAVACFVATEHGCTAHQDACIASPSHRVVNAPDCGALSLL